MPQVQTPIDPRGMTFDAWANAMRVQNRNLPRSAGEASWRDWALESLQFEPDWPDARQFGSWAAWAAATLLTI